MKKVLPLVMVLLLAACDNQYWTPKQIDTALSYCKNNEGIKHLVILPGNSSLYTIKCNDNAIYKYIERRPD